MSILFRFYLIILAVQWLPDKCSGQQQSRPNIIFILTDDHRADALGAMGNQFIQTPNLDRLANEGLLFQNAYVTTSICCVSRASILSGQYESRHGINDFTTDFTDEALNQTYPVLLKKAGYHIGYIGKYGVGLKKQPREIFDYWSCTSKIQPDYLLQDAGGHEVHNTDSVGRDILKFLDAFAGKGPFCLSVGFKAPHELDGKPPKMVIQERYATLYENISIPEPLTADPKFWNSFPDFFRSDSNIARERWKTFFSTPELYQKSVKDYYRLVSGVDEVIGQMMERLKRLGIDKNTIIIFAGDNGFYLGEHGLEGKWYGHEESIRIPMILYDPRDSVSLHHIKVRQIALNIDIAPTILSLAHVAVPARMQGKDLYSIVREPSRKAFFYEHTYLGSPRLPKVEGVVTARYKYMIYIEHQYEELYDIKNDPHEQNNLAKDPKYSHVLNDMRRQYKAEKFKAS